MKIHLNSKNIFLTGAQGVGKSTIITHLRQHFSEFKWRGFVTEPIRDSGSKFTGYQIRSVQSTTGQTIARLISTIPQNQFKIFPEAFNEHGVRIIETALATGSIILMDELGIFESEAIGFQKTVFKAIDSNRIVLGVLKNKPNPFLEQIRQRKNVIVFDVNLSNRQNIAAELRVWFGRELKYQRNA
jgi:nucleoside-triphosphatase